jgi:hypothetical protein
MKSFKSIVVSKQPLDRLWIAVRDHLSELAARLDDIERIDVIEREALSGGRVRVVNEWRAKPRLPISIESITGTDAFVWRDHAEWHDGGRRCEWRIEPQFFRGRISCRGVTTYESALGGRGTKATFAGELDLAPGALPGAGMLVERTVMPIVESIVTVVIPKNFRKIVEAADGFVTRQA